MKKTTNKERPQKEFRFSAKFAEKVLFPVNAVEYSFGGSTMDYEPIFLTIDGKKSIPKFHAIWDNTDGRYTEELDSLCQREYNLSFRELRSMWFARLGDIKDIWYFIKLQAI